MTTDPAQVVLVHGAWHDSSCWTRLRAELSEVGIATTAIDLPSSGGTGDLAADVAAVSAALDGLSGPVTVVGHSYGGIPITQATGGRTDVSHLVYVCAFQLDVGESLLGALAGDVPGWIAVDEQTGVSSVPEPLPVFYADVDPDVAAAAMRTLKTQTLSSFADPLTAAGWHDIPSTYVGCTQDQAIPYPAQQAMSARAGTVHTLESSHSPFLSHPAHLARIIAGIA